MDPHATADGNQLTPKKEKKEPAATRSTPGPKFQVSGALQVLLLWLLKRGKKNKINENKRRPVAAAAQTGSGRGEGCTIRIRPVLVFALNVIGTL